MSKTWEAIYLPTTDSIDPSRGGFKTEWEAWDYASRHYCTECKKLYNKGIYDACDAEWMVCKEESKTDK